MKNKTKVGETIKRLRIERGWTQRDVANKLSISIPAVSKIEFGQTDINFSRLEEIAKIYGLSVSQLISYRNITKFNSTPASELEKKIHEYDLEISALQKKIIELYDKLNSNL